MASDETIKGYRPQADRPKQRSLSFDYLQQSSKSARLLAELWRRAPEENAPCVGKAEWTADELPTDRQAQLMCAPCPLLVLCEEYRQAAHPSWGVWSGKVQGRNLRDAMMAGGDE